MRAEQTFGLGQSELAILELLTVQPVRYFPPRHLAIARRLAEQGFLRRAGRSWFPTRSGLERIGITIH